MDDFCLAAVIHSAKMKVIQGDTLNMERINRDLSKKIKKNTYLSKIVRSVNVWVSLLQGESKTAEEWSLQAPDSREFFSLMDRYEYILKARINIMKGEYQNAQILLTRLRDVFEEYSRDYLWIKVELLMAVLFYRMHSPRWQTCFTEALKRAESFRYIRVIADEGAAVLPLFDNIQEEERKRFDRSWYDRTEKAVREMAGLYPGYLREKIMEGISLTRSEKKVMDCLCRGMSSEEVCQHLHISYSGLKYHKRNIYRKMGVRTLEEALSTAKAMGIEG